MRYRKANIPALAIFVLAILFALIVISQSPAVKATTLEILTTVFG